LAAVLDRFVDAQRDAQTLIEDEIPLAWRTLADKAPSDLVRICLRAAAAPHTNYSIDWALGEAIEPARDRGVLLDFVRESGVDAARLVADTLDADKPGFWELAADLVAVSGGDERVASRLIGRLGSGAGWGSLVPMIERRLEAGKRLLARSDPAAAPWVREAVSFLEDWRLRALREDREDWIWDAHVRRADLEAMLQRRQSPERLWAIGRLLEDGPVDRVRQLLTAEDILDALPRLPQLDETTRAKWEAWARSGSRSH
jgi:hypothetical protein